MTSARSGEELVAVAVIAKEPVAGRVKTRLVPPLSDSQAAKVAAASLADTLSLLDSTLAGRAGIRRVLYLEGDPGSWVPDGWDILHQCQGGLGERLDALFEALGGPAVVFGMDTPQIDAASVLAVLDSLTDRRTDAVIGPACDGGYWTIGFRRHVPGAFEGVPMSEPGTAAAQLEVLSTLGMSVATVGELRDIDHWDDALAVAATNPHLETASVVSEIAGQLGGGVDVHDGGR